MQVLQLLATNFFGRDPLLAEEALVAATDQFGEHAAYRLLMQGA
jgi:hypothetical protein